jgi:hypothetical protein
VPSEHNDMVSCCYRAKNLCQYGRTGDINHLQFRGVKYAFRDTERRATKQRGGDSPRSWHSVCERERRTPREREREREREAPPAPPLSSPYRRCAWSAALRGGWTDAGGVRRSLSATGPPWRSMYTHDWCGNQTWAQGNGGDCFSWCSIMDHYMNEVSPIGATPAPGAEVVSTCVSGRCLTPTPY